LVEPRARFASSPMKPQRVALLGPACSTARALGSWTYSWMWPLQGKGIYRQGPWEKGDGWAGVTTIQKGAFPSRSTTGAGGRHDYGNNASPANQGGRSAAKCAGNVRRLIVATPQPPSNSAINGYFNPARILSSTRLIGDGNRLGQCRVGVIFRGPAKNKFTGTWLARKIEGARNFQNRGIPAEFLQRSTTRRFQRNRASVTGGLLRGQRITGPWTAGRRQPRGRLGLHVGVRTHYLSHAVNPRLIQFALNIIF